MWLSDCPVPASVRVLGVHVDDDVRSRIAELGLRPGALLRVTQHADFGGIVVAATGCRLAVDAATAHRVKVRPVPAR
ncbi:FeoA family protein [Georgenia muralis]